MSNVLSLYFDGTIVQAVKVRIAGNTVSIREASTFRFDELDDFLSLCRDKSCVVCSNPPLFHQDIVLLPPGAAKLYDKLVRTEIRNTHPDLTSFGIFHRIIGETLVDNRPFTKIAAFSYPDEFLSGFIQTLNRHGMFASHIYPASASIFRLAASTCPEDPDRTRVFIATLPGEKLFLVSENNELEFIRKIPSDDSAMLPEDAQNVNMTVDYCFQSLRVRPFEAVMLNQPGESEEIAAFVSVPYRAALPPKLEALPPDIIEDYLAPLAAALHSVESPATGNIRPADYALFSAHRKILTAAATAMFVMALLLAGHLAAEWMIISGLKSKIVKMRTELGNSAGELATFRKLDAEANQLKLPLELINRHNSSINPATALATLILPESKEYMVKGITVQSGEKNLNIQIDGATTTSGYSGTQAAFEELVARVAKIPGYAVSSSRADVLQKSFTIQARYSSGKAQKQ